MWAGGANAGKGFMAPIVEISALTKRYPGSAEPAVKGIDLVIEQGEIFGVLGPNGAGKTTLISMLSCLIAPHTWGLMAYQDVLMRGADVAAILPAAAVLIGFAVVFFSVGVWRFRWD